MTMTKTQNLNTCPKCGSTMTPRKIWKKFQATHINQCKSCKFYILNEDYEENED